MLESMLRSLYVFDNILQPSMANSALPDNPLQLPARRLA